jgi:fatty-acid desaturase
MKDEFSKAGYIAGSDADVVFEHLVNLDLSYQLHNICTFINVYFGVENYRVIEKDSWKIHYNFHQRIIDIQEDHHEDTNTSCYFSYLDHCMRYTNAYSDDKFYEFRSACERGRDIGTRLASLDTGQRYPA